VDKVVRRLVSNEVAAMVPRLAEYEELHAHHLRDAIAAAGPTEKELADLDAEIAAMDAEAASWRAQAAPTNANIPQRVAARTFLSEWQKDMDPLIEKRGQLERDVQPLRAAVDTARKQLQDATDEKHGAETIAADQSFAYLWKGQETSAYKSFRFGLVFEDVLCNPGHPEHQAAVDAMTSVCLHSGYRTSGRNLPSDSEHWASMWREFQQRANPAEPTPSGREVIEMQRAAIEVPQQIAREQAALDRNVVEDNRTPMPEAARTAQEMLHTAARIRQDMSKG
jgi:hypothetical protein